MIKEKPIQAHIAEIDLSLLEAPSDKDESSYFGSGMFGSCQKMFQRCTPVAFPLLLQKISKEKP